MLQGKSTAKQAHAELKQRYEADHMGPPPRSMKYPDIMCIPEYKAAYKSACAAAEPEKGLRPDRDPQVGGLAQWQLRHRLTPVTTLLSVAFIVRPARRKGPPSRVVPLLDCGAPTASLPV